MTPRAALEQARLRRPLLDHLVRTYQRYQGDTGDRLASAVTFYWFLSLFPILLIAVYVTSLALGAHAGHQITTGLGPYLGTSTAKAVGNVVENSAHKAGVIGLLGTVATGLGWIQALREAIRTLWHQQPLGGNFVTVKLADVVALVSLFAVIGGSVTLSGLVNQGTSSVLDVLGLSGTHGAGLLTKVVGYLLGVLVDLGIFVFLFTWLARVPVRVRTVLPGAVFGALGFEVLKFFAAYYVGTFAVVVGLLLFLHLVTRLVLYAAAFVVTAPYDSDVLPSGTAGLRETVLMDVDRSWAPKAAPVAEDPPSPAPAQAPLPYERHVKLAAHAIAAASGAVVLAVGVHVVRTAARVLRR
jgi:membrane protein